jgi:hypothetical protein
MQIALESRFLLMRSAIGCEAAPWPLHPVLHSGRKDGSCPVQEVIDG